MNGLAPAEGVDRGLIDEIYGFLKSQSGGAEENEDEITRFLYGRLPVCCHASSIGRPLVGCW
eukprot:SAG11_NODE_20369_length_447_cov_0.577586_1_plen_61_part_10